MTDYTFQRYLSAKRTVDDRALNWRVWQALSEQLRTIDAHPLRVLEIGAGIGTMVERAQSWRLFDPVYHPLVEYTAIDEQAENIDTAQQLLATLPDRFTLKLEQADLFDFVERTEEFAKYDLLIAHAFLDLVDIAQTLPLLRRLMREDGLLYFTINFDGVTSLQPEIDPAFDAQIEALYHRTMDERVIDGVPSGDSHSGRHMFNHLREAGIDILAAGSSDWVVFGGKGGYPADEAYFLHFIVNTMHGALAQHPELDQPRFAEWINLRHQQIDSGDLVYIAHQVDFLASL